MNLNRRCTHLFIRTEGDRCDYCGKHFKLDESILQIVDSVTEDSVYVCNDREACEKRVTMRVVADAH